MSMIFRHICAKGKWAKHPNDICFEYFLKEILSKQSLINHNDGILQEVQKKSGEIRFFFAC